MNEIRQLGYPLNCSPLPTKIIKKLAPHLSCVLNNLGDPFVGSNYKFNTFTIERSIIKFMMDLFHTSTKDSWGYVTSCGSESNFRALSLAYIKYPDAAFYYSDASHYSIINTINLLTQHDPSKRKIIKTDAQHRIDLLHLKHQIDYSIPAIISFNIGTVMSGAIDPIINIDIPHYIHVDAALSGMILPFLSTQLISPFDFRTKIDSIAVSGHKFLGCPIPCGVFICRKHDLPNTTPIQYIGSNNTTLFGSRSGFAVMLLWNIIKHYGYAGISKMVQYCFELKQYAIDQFNLFNIPHWHNPLSTMIMIPRPTDWIIQKWQLAVNNGESHIILMPHVTQNNILEFVQDLRGKTLCSA